MNLTQAQITGEDWLKNIGEFVDDISKSTEKEGEFSLGNNFLMAFDKTTLSVYCGEKKILTLDKTYFLEDKECLVNLIAGII